MHLDPLAPDLAARTRRWPAGWTHSACGVTVETGARYVLDPRRKHGPSLLDPDPDARAARVRPADPRRRRSPPTSAPTPCTASAASPRRTRTDGHRLAAARRGTRPPYSTPPTAAGVPLAVEPEPGHLLATLADFHRLRTALGDPEPARPDPRHRPLPVPGTPAARRLRTRRRPLAAARPDRGHAPRRPRAPALRRRRDRLPAGARSAGRHRLPGPDRRRTAPPLPRGPRTRPHAPSTSCARGGTARATHHRSRHRRRTPTAAQATTIDRRPPASPTCAPASTPRLGGAARAWLRPAPLRRGRRPPRQPTERRPRPGSCASPRPDAAADAEHADAARVLLLHAARADTGRPHPALRPGHRRRTPRRPARPAPPGARPRRPCPLVEDALRTNDTRLVAAAVGPYAAAHLDAARLAARRPQVPVHRCPRRRRRRPGPRAPAATPNSPACSATTPTNAPPRAAPSPTTCTASWP